MVSFILFLKKREQIDFVLYYDAATVAEEQIFMGIRWFPGRLAWEELVIVFSGLEMMSLVHLQQSRQAGKK